MLASKVPSVLCLEPAMELPSVIISGSAQGLIRTTA
jgi:hypothetical protein